MNKGFRGWARPRNKVFVSAPQVIDTTNGNTFRHGFGRVPGNVVGTLICVTANNGYVAGDVIPVESIIFDDSEDNDGWTNWQYRSDVNKTVVLIGTQPTDFRDTTGSRVTWVAAQWKLQVRCRDIERLT